MPRDRLNRRGGPFSYEPYDVYERQESKRAQYLAKTALQEKVGEAAQRVQGIATPWGTLPHIPDVRSGRTTAPDLPDIPDVRKRGGGWRGALDKATPEFAESAVKATGRGALQAGEGALKALDVTNQYAASVPASLFTRGEVSPEGEYTTHRNLVGNPISNIRSHYSAQQQAGDIHGGGNVLQRAVEGVKAQGRTGRAFLEDPDIQPAVKVGASAAANPLTYVGPGMVGGALSHAPQAIQASRGARIAGSLLEVNPRVQLGAIGGQAAGAQLAKEVDLPHIPDWVLPLAGGAAGGLAAARGRGVAPVHAAVEETAERPRVRPEPVRPEEPKVSRGQPPIDRSSPIATLGLDPAQEHTAEDVRQAYRQRMRAYHPDVNESPTATADATAINDAFDRLSGGYAPGAPTAPPVEPGVESIRAPRPPRRSEDLFSTVSREQRVGEEEAFRGSLRGKVDTTARRVLPKSQRQDTEVSPFTVKEKNRIENLTSSFEGYADELFQRVERAGVSITRQEDGNFALPDGTSFEDMVELKTPAGRRAYAGLTAEQQAAVDELQKFNGDLNANLRFHGGKALSWDEFEENYFPRMAKAYDGAERAGSTTGSRSMGAELPYEKKRVFDTLAEGTEAGLDYAHPREAYRGMVRAKLRSASDDYLISRLKPLGQTAAELEAAGGHAGFGYRPLRDAPGLSGTLFPADVAKKVEQGLNGQDAIRLGPVNAVNRVLTPFRAMADISWLGQQGAPLLFRHPVKAAKGAAAVIGAEVFKKPQLYGDLVEAEASRGPGLKELVKGGLHWAPEDLGDIDVIGKSGIPVVKQVAGFSNRTYGRYLNYQRLVFANDAAERLAKLGLEGDELVKETRGAMNAVNRLSGFTGRKPTSFERTAEFAPRYFSAAVEQLAAAVSKGGMEGSIARRHMLTMLVGGAALVYGANKLRGEETEWDPRSTNFLRIRNVGGIDISPFGTYSTLFRALAQTAANPDGVEGRVDALSRFGEGKLSPAIQTLYHELVVKRNYAGEPLDIVNNPGKSALEEFKGAIPFGASGIIEEGIQPSIEERSAKPLVEALPGVAASFIGATNSPLTPSEKLERARESVAKDQFGSSYDELSGRDKSLVNEDDRVTKLVDESARNKLDKAGEAGQRARITETARTKTEALTDRFAKGEISGSEFRDALSNINLERRARMKDTGDDEPGDDVGRWFALYDQATRADGTLDRDQLEQLQAQFQGDHPDILDEVDRSTGVYDNEVMRRYRAAAKDADEYYAIPAYAGMSVEESTTAARVAGLAGRLVSNGQAPSTKAAYGMLVEAGLATQPEIGLAARAAKAGSNPQRRAFLASHPEFALFYRDAVGGDAFVAAGTFRPQTRRAQIQDRRRKQAAFELPEIPDYRQRSHRG